MSVGERVVVSIPAKEEASLVGKTKRQLLIDLASTEDRELQDSILDELNLILMKEEVEADISALDPKKKAVYKRPEYY
jgi:hypothetical protein